MDEDMGSRARRLIGERIRQLREMRGLSLRDLHLRCSIPESTLEHIEGGLMLMGLDCLESIARALGVPVMELFAEAEE